MARNGLQTGLWLVLGVLTFVACTSSPEDRRDSDTSTKRDGGTTTIQPNCAGLDGGTNVDGGRDAGLSEGDGGAICTCPDGYELDAGLCHHSTCTGCDPNATCSLVMETRTCTCNEGFTGDGITCTATQHGCGTCGANASCHQVDNKSRCLCDEGYQGDGQTCTVVQSGCGTCGANATCEHTGNESRCVCDEGYTGDGQTCTAIPECARDSDCQTNQRCCVASGTCHDVVGAGADCDCEHPCPTTQGCFPGICGDGPSKCRPGCYPGDQNTKADRCSPTSTGVVTFCKQLPVDQRTADNKGGACAVGDNCSVTQQNCPDLPLDRTQPVGPANPAVPQTCVPVSPYATGCYPAGTKTVGGQNCEYDNCGDTSAACARGLLCVGLLDDPTAPTTCNKQCSNPSDFPVPSTECGAGLYCVALYGPGQEQVKTGVCQSF